MHAHLHLPSSSPQTRKACHLHFLFGLVPVVGFGYIGPPGVMSHE